VAHLRGDEFRTCCNAVSRVNSQTGELAPCKDERLQQSLDLLRSELPENFSWPHREGLAQALKHAAIKWLTNTKVHVTKHLDKRIRRWLVVRLGADVNQDGIVEKHLWTIADRVVSTLTWHGEKGKAGGECSRSPPSYARPENIDALLGTRVLEKLPPLEQGTKDHIWRLFEEMLTWLGDALPLCQWNFGESADDARYGPPFLHFPIPIPRVS
jgi:hypothetical protein